MQIFPECPQYDFSKGTNFNETFYRIENLNKVPPLDVSSGITFSSMFIACPALTSIDLTGLTGASSTANGRSFDYMFQACSSLRIIKGLCLANAINLQQCFNSTALDYIPADLPAGMTTGLPSSAFSTVFAFMNYLKTIGNFNMSGFTGATYAHNVFRTFLLAAIV
jgi:hypothetical protein